MKISEEMVLRSAAGYYIGEQYYDDEYKAWFPYSRISEYYATYQEAEADLKFLHKVLGKVVV